MTIDINIDTNYIGILEGQKIIHLIDKNEGKINRININLLNTIEKIDITFISYLILVKRNFNIDIINIKTGKLNSPVKYTLLQYQFLAALGNGASVFSLNSNSNYYSNVQNYSKNNIRLSNSFFVPIVIDTKDTYIFFCKTKIGEFLSEIKIINIKEYLQTLKFVNSSYQIDNYLKSLKNYFNLAFQELKNEMFNRENFDDTAREQDFQKFKEIDLESLTLLQFCIFYYSATNIFFRDTKDRKVSHTFTLTDINLVTLLISRSIEISLGIEELLKNIIQHSEPQLGVFTVRSFTKAIWSELNKYSDEKFDTSFNDYIKELPNVDQINRFFDINVIDLSNKGIISTFTHNEMVNAQESNRGDIPLAIENFFDYRKGIPSVYQAKRSVAHLGLLIYSHNIFKANGLITVQTENGVAVINLKKVTQKLEVNEKFYGTRIQSVIPFIDQFVPTSDIDRSNSTPLDSSVHFTNIEKIFDIEISEYNNFDKFKSKQQNQIVFFSIEKDNLKEQRSLFEKIPDLNEKRIFDFTIIFNEYSGDVSELYRFLGMWEIHYPKINLNIVNLDVKLIKELYEVNDLLHTQFQTNAKDNIDQIHLPYWWNKDKVLIFYSYYKNPDNGKKFFFTDYFYGETKKQFIKLNRFFSQNNFNTISILTRSEYLDDSVTINEISAKFKYVLPLDLKLKIDGKTIFEYNAEYLLQKNIT